MVVARDGRVGVGLNPSGLSGPRLDVSGDIRCFNLIETSTERFKVDVIPLNNPLESVLALRPVRFRWDEPHGGRPDLGLLAEQVRAVVPELVTTDPDGHAAGLNYGRLGVLAVGAIAELREQHQRELNDLRAQHAKEQLQQRERFDAALKALMERVKALEARTPRP
jgi:hypothetical protein